MVKHHYGIVSEDYKLVHFYDDITEWELYDRKKDKLEIQNVYEDPNYEKVSERLKKELVDLRKYYKDSEELDQKYIHLHKERN